MLDLPHADRRATTRSCAGSTGQVFAHLPFAADDEARTAGCRRRVVLGVPSNQHGAARHAGELQRRLRRPAAAQQRRTARVRTVRDRTGAHAHHAVSSSEGYRPTAGRSHPPVGAVRDLSHADHDRRSDPAGSDRPAARTGAVSGVAAQRLQGHAELPVVPHAGR